MSRSPAFDKDAAVKAALDVFWRDGYAETALPTLEKATGLNRSSIYNTFGSKRGLFDAVVEYYLDHVVRPRLRPLLADAPSAAALTEYLEGLSYAFENLDSTAGCLLVNASGTSLSQDPEVARVIRNYLQELRGAITRGVLAARPELFGEAHTNLVDTLTGLLISAFTVVRVDKAAAIDILATARSMTVTSTQDPRGV